MTGRQTRAERAAYPLARDAIRKLAEASGPGSTSWRRSPSLSTCKGGSSSMR